MFDSGSYAIGISIFWIKTAQKLKLFSFVLHKMLIEHKEENPFPSCPSAAQETPCF